MEKTSNQLTIGFLSQFDPHDRKASSGTSYKMAEQLSKMGELKWIPIKISTTGKWLLRILNYVNRRLDKKIVVRMTELGSRCSCTIDKNLIEECDVITAFFCSDVLATISFSKPVIYFTDATFPVLLDYHPSFSNVWNFNKRQGCKMESRMLNNVSYAVFGSDWARDSAIKDLGGKPEKMKVVEFGPNIDEKDIVSQVRTFSKGTTLRLLFLGVNWERKGGPKAVDACKWLIGQGMDVRLSIVGIRELPQEISLLPFVDNHGFLDKNNPTDYDKLVQTISDSHILILPTINECAGIAFAEASAYGLPIITHDTGGIANYVINGHNGYRLPLSSTAIDFGKKIADLLESNKLEQLSRNAISLYNDKLNYNRWGGDIWDLIKGLCG